MERRTFLHGMLASVAAGTALVTLASAEETAQLVPETPVLIGHPPLVPGIGFAPVGRTVYMKVGDAYESIGYVTAMHVEEHDVELTSAGEVRPAYQGSIAYVPGLRRVSLDFASHLTGLVR